MQQPAWQGGRGAGRPPSAGNIPSTESSWSGATAALSRLLASERLSLSAPCDSQEVAIGEGALQESAASKLGGVITHGRGAQETWFTGVNHTDGRRHRLSIIRISRLSLSLFRRCTRRWGRLQAGATGAMTETQTALYPPYCCIRS